MPTRIAGYFKSFYCSKDLVAVEVWDEEPKVLIYSLKDAEFTLTATVDTQRRSVPPIIRAEFACLTLKHKKLDIDITQSSRLGPNSNPKNTSRVLLK